MINFNGTLVEKDKAIFVSENRGFKYGDGLFETMKVASKKILFWEDHYFRLMSSMRIMRMEIPMTFTMEFLEAEILKTINVNSYINARVRLNVYRGNGGNYLPENNNVSYSISVDKIPSGLYEEFDRDATYRVDLFKDYYINPGLLSTLKSSNKLINILGSIYAKENDLENCLLLNSDKSVVEANNANLFLVKDKVIKTPPIINGCLKGVMRKQLMEMIKKDPDLQIEESAISSFELQKADELFISNVIIGIRSITNYRKKQFSTKIADELRAKINKRIELLVS